MKDKGNGNGKEGNGNGKEKHEPSMPAQAIVTREPAREITVQPEPLLLAPVMDIALARRRLAEFQEFVRGYLVEGEDFGVIPGTPKPTLLKPGADKLCELYGLADSYRILTDVEDFSAEPALFDYTIECSLSRGGRLVSTGLGSCNSYESKYRWREAQRTCPVCGKSTIIKGKEEYGGGWLCWTKKDGCGAKFADGDAKIESQQAGRVPNEDTATLKNTILKMAKKRCLGSNVPVLVKTKAGVSRVRIDTMFMMYRDGTDMWLPGAEKNWVKVLAMVREERPHGVNLGISDGSHLYTSPEHVFPVGSDELAVSDMRIGTELLRTPIAFESANKVDPEIGWVAGLFVAEGHVYKTGVSFTLNAKKEEFVERIAHVAEKLGGHVHAQPRATSQTLDVDINGPAFKGLIEQFVVGLDRGCYSKHLSRYCWRQGKEFIEALARGYIAGDGHQLDRPGRVQRKYILGFTRENFALAEDLRTLATILGWRILLKAGTSTCQGQTYPTYEGWVSEDEPSYNGKPLNLVENLTVVNKPAVLYDIEVEDPHLFVLPNGIISHNSKIDATLAATRSSGIFTQDMEDVPPPPEAKPPIQQPMRASARRPPQPPPDPEPAHMATTITMPISGSGINSGQQKMLFAATRDYVKRHNPGWNSAQIEEEIRTKVKTIIKRFKPDSESTGDIPQSAFDDILDELGAIRRQ